MRLISMPYNIRGWRWNYSGKNYYIIIANKYNIRTWRKCSPWSVMKMSLLSNATFLLCEETSRHCTTAPSITVAAVVINAVIMGSACDTTLNEKVCPPLVTLNNRAIGSSSISVSLTSVVSGEWSSKVNTPLNVSCIVCNASKRQHLSRTDMHTLLWK